VQPSKIFDGNLLRLEPLLVLHSTHKYWTRAVVAPIAIDKHSCLLNHHIVDILNSNNLYQIYKNMSCRRYQQEVQLNTDL
jgi:hypothetical protein